MPEPQGLLIRAAGLVDVPGLTDLANQPGYHHGTLRPPYQSEEETRRFLTGLTASDLLLVAVLEERIVGNAGLHRLAGRRAHAASIGMGVHDSYRRQGIGHALMNALLEVADGWWDTRRVELTVYADNLPAIALYERHGFEREGVLRAYAFRAGRYVDTLAVARLRGLG